MAKIKFGMMMTDASGKLGGQVFSKNRGGSYVRTKGIPTNPQNVAQMYIRGIFASLSSQWSALTEAQRTSFNNFVTDYGKTDVFGDVRNPSGKNLFQRLNQNLSLTAQTLVTTCVAPSEVPFANISNAVIEIGNATAEINTTGNTTGSKFLVFATPSLTQGTTFIKNKLRSIGYFDGGNGSVIDVQTAYVAKFGNPSVSANIYFGVKVINSNGQASPMETVKATVSA
jgi:hypothetical protein